MLQHVVLVGGFASSDWLYSEVSRELGAKNLKVMRPEIYLCVLALASAWATFLKPVLCDVPLTGTKPSQTGHFRSI